MDFTTAAEKVKTLTQRPSDEELLSLYGLYKQVTEGDCHTKQPWAIDIKNRAKWDAWNGYQGMSKEDAEKAYIELVEKLLE